MTAPTEVAPDQARHDYIARVYKMSHSELFAELMRVHTEANRLVEQAVKDEREACADLCLQGTDMPMQTNTLEILKAERNRIAQAIRVRGQS